MSPSRSCASSVCQRRGPPQEPPSPKATKNATEITRFFAGKEGNRPLKAIKWKVFLIRFTLSPSWVGASPIHHPRGRPQSPKAAKYTNEITKFCSAIVYVGNEGNSPLKASNVKSFWLALPRHPPGVAHYPSLTSGAPLRAPKRPKVPPR